MKILSVVVFKQSPIVLADIIGRDVLRRCVVITAPGFARAIMPPVIIKWELSFVWTLMWWRVLSRGSRIMLKVLFRVSHCEGYILYASISGLTKQRRVSMRASTLIPRVTSQPISALFVRKRLIARQVKLISDKIN